MRVQYLSALPDFSWNSLYPDLSGYGLFCLLLKMCAGFIFRIYDALDPVPEMPHLRMDTED